MRVLMQARWKTSLKSKHCHTVQPMFDTLTTNVKFRMFNLFHKIVNSELRYRASDRMRW